MDGSKHTGGGDVEGSAAIITLKGRWTQPPPSRRRGGKNSQPTDASYFRHSNKPHRGSDGGEVDGGSIFVN